MVEFAYACALLASVLLGAWGYGRVSWALHRRRRARWLAAVDPYLAAIDEALDDAARFGERGVLVVRVPGEWVRAIVDRGLASAAEDGSLLLHAPRAPARLVVDPALQQSAIATPRSFEVPPGLRGMALAALCFGTLALGCGHVEAPRLPRVPILNPAPRAPACPAGTECPR